MRTVKKAELFEVSPVGQPAYPQNLSTLLRNAPTAIRERLLRDNGEIEECSCFCEYCSSQRDMDDDADAYHNDCTADTRCELCNEDTDGERSLLVTLINRRRTIL